MVDKKMVEEGMRKVLLGMGLDVDHEEGLMKTPNRVMRFYSEYMNSINLIEVLGTTFERPRAEPHTMVCQEKIPFRGLCEHHLLPFFGEVAIGYIPSERVVGLSKLSRLVDAAGIRRPSIQERINEEIVDALMEGLNAEGAIAVIRAEHTCMTVRGINKPGVITTTSAIRGIFEEDLGARQEFLSLVRWS